MNLRNLSLGTLAYTLVTFPLAIVWHLVLFEPRYAAFGYFEGEPVILLGLLTILLQGILLSVLYPRLSLSGSGVKRGLKFAALTGSFFWTSHVLAFVAKQSVPHAGMYVLMETGYLGLQFGIFGVLIGLIHPCRPESSTIRSASDA